SPSSSSVSSAAGTARGLEFLAPAFGAREPASASLEFAGRRLPPDAAAGGPSAAPLEGTDRTASQALHFTLLPAYCSGTFSVLPQEQATTMGMTGPPGSGTHVLQHSGRARVAVKRAGITASVRG